jgi:tryptophan-rich sensory protein
MRGAGLVGATQRKGYVPDAIGLVALMAMVAIMSAFIPPSKVPGPLWVAIYFAWAASALYVWHKVEGRWKRWPLIVVASMGGAVLWYVVTRAISRLVFGDGESELSKVFDLVVVLIMSPGITFIALAGWVRQLTQGKAAESSRP